VNVVVSKAVTVYFLYTFVCEPEALVGTCSGWNLEQNLVREQKKQETNMTPSASKTTRAWRSRIRDETPEMLNGNLHLFQCSAYVDRVCAKQVIRRLLGSRRNMKGLRLQSRGSFGGQTSQRLSETALSWYERGKTIQNSSFCGFI